MAESIVNVTEGSGKKLHTYQRTIGANSVEDEVILHGEQYLATYNARTAGVSMATVDSHLLQVMAGASLNLYVRRISVFQVVLATTAALAFFDLTRLTTAGTGGGALAPSPFDTTDAASGATAMTLPSAKGTEAAVIASAGAYFMQTVAATVPPQATLLAEWDFDLLRGKALRIPAGTANGLVVKNRTAVAGAQVLIGLTFSEANF